MIGGLFEKVTKIPGISAIKYALRPSPAVPPAEQSLHSASWNSSPVIVISQNSSDLTAATVDKSSRTAGFEDREVERSSGEPLPRVVFDRMLGYDEATEATTQLKDALEKVHLSSTNSGTDYATPAGQFLGLSLVSNSSTEGKATVASEAVAAYAAPSHAVQAFRLLSQSPAARDVVASIASDPCVFDAVLQNEAFRGFVLAVRTRSELTSEASAEDAGMEDGKSATMFEDVSHDDFLEKLERSLMSVFQKVKLSVIDRVSNISGFLYNIFSRAGANKNTADDANSGSLPEEETFGVSFMKLAILVVMVVLLKRV